MSVLAPELAGASVLDLFAGSGALGIEALSRGAGQVVFVERAPGALRALRANLERLGVGGEAEVVADDVFRYLAGRGEPPADIALADPPYGSGDAGRLAAVHAERPVARLLCLEHDRREALPEVPAMDRRRYGDTVLTFLAAQP